MQTWTVGRCLWPMQFTSCHRSRAGRRRESNPGDWQLNGIVSFLGGTPLDVRSNADTAGLGEPFSQRPDLVPGQPIYLESSNKLNYLNPAAFALPGVGRFGTLGRGAVVGPGVANVDFSLNKNWRVRERFGVQFRAEMFNLFNRANFIGNGGGESARCGAISPEYASQSSFGQSPMGTLALSEAPVGLGRSSSA